MARERIEARHSSPTRTGSASLRQNDRSESLGRVKGSLAPLAAPGKLCRALDPPGALPRIWQLPEPRAYVSQQGTQARGRWLCLDAVHETVLSFLQKPSANPTADRIKTAIGWFVKA